MGSLSLRMPCRRSPARPRSCASPCSLMACAGGLQILPGVKVGRDARAKYSRMEAVMARRRSESILILHTRHAGSLAQLILGHAYGIGHIAAVFVDHLHKFLGHGGRTVQHDGEAGQTLGHLLQHVEAQRRRTRCPFVAGALAAVNLYAPWLVPMAMARESHAGAW